jgi:hypothetical protein
MAGAMWKVTFALPVPAAFVALTATVYGLPAASVGVPVIAPVPVATTSPGGSPVAL